MSVAAPKQTITTSRGLLDADNVKNRTKDLPTELEEFKVRGSFKRCSASKDKRNEELILKISILDEFISMSACLSSCIFLKMSFKN